MKYQLSRRDLEAISAYLDGELGDRERRRLEARLRADVDLQEALEGLRHTRLLVRGLPRMRAPRRFTLTPQMAGVRRPVPRAFPALSLASALATLLLAVVLLGDITGYLRPAPPMAAALRVADSEAPVEAEQAPLGAIQEAAPFFVEEGAVTPGIEQPMEVEPGVEGEIVTEPQVLTQTLDTVEKVAAETEPPATAESAPVSEPVAGQEPAFYPAPSPDETAPDIEGGFPAVRVAEIALAIIAVSTALAAILLRRSAG